MTTSPTSSSSKSLREIVAANLATIKNQIADAGRDVDDVTIVAVTKTFSVDAILAALDVGISTVGENYVTELVEKHSLLSTLPLTWQFLGHIQSNKINKILNNADLVATLSRRSEVDGFASRGATQKFYVQVDYTGRDLRNGTPPSEVGDLARYALDQGLNVVGLMTVAPPDEVGAATAFRALAMEADRLDLAVRSMGMSGDFAMACRYGATEIRLGQALFGSRNP